MKIRGEWLERETLPGKCSGCRKSCSRSWAETRSREELGKMEPKARGVARRYMVEL